MLRRGFKALTIRPFAESCGLLLRNFSGNSRKKPKFVRRPPLNPKCNLVNWPTLQRLSPDRVVDEQDEKPYSTFKIDTNRLQEMWQQTRIAAREQNSLRGHQPANSDLNSDSEDVITALDKVRQIEERRKIQNRMRSLMEKQQELEERNQDELDRLIPRKEVPVEREPARQQAVPREYSPVRSQESTKPGSWMSATVLAATGKILQHRYMQRPPRMTTTSYQTESQSEIPARPEIPGSAPGNKSPPSSQAKISLQELAKSVVELHKIRAEEMDKTRTREEYSKDSACLKLCDLSAIGRIRHH
ncbi:uncharacterized protein LOC108027502 isoform X2 [Drosophila biarmipes]|uniref:uncharacterized protein LOC108027502 isoform X2 n=1 Tax=Drosophila biarmipes TaxID=125945 RepID=UPI0021CD1800|nr:uncharacterized protein LOC108027502 isoform X2 [Drosophila biarmipes]